MFRIGNFLLHWVMVNTLRWNYFWRSLLFFMNSSFMIHRATLSFTLISKNLSFSLFWTKKVILLTFNFNFEFILHMKIGKQTTSQYLNGAKNNIHVITWNNLALALYDKITLKKYFVKRKVHKNLNASSEIILLHFVMVVGNI